MSQLVHRYSVTAATPASELWKEFTRTEKAKPYFFDAILRGTIAPGQPYQLVLEDPPRLFVEGVTLEAEPSRRLVQTFRFADLSEVPTQVEWELDRSLEGTRIAITHRGFRSRGEAWKRATRMWSQVLDGLVAVLDSGKLPVWLKAQNALMRQALLYLPKGG